MLDKNFYFAIMFAFFNINSYGMRKQFQPPDVKHQAKKISQKSEKTLTETCDGRANAH